MGVVMLRGSAHRRDDGVSPAARGRIGNALPDRAVRPALELLELLAVVRDVTEQAGGHGSCPRSSCLHRITRDGSHDDLMQAPIVSSKEGRRVGRVEGLFRSNRTLQDALRTKAAMGKRVGAQRCKRGCGLTYSEARPANDLQNTLLPSQLRFDALNAAASAAYTAQTIAERVAPRGSHGGGGGGIEEGNKLDDGVGTSAERLPLAIRV